MASLDDPIDFIAAPTAKPKAKAIGKVMIRQP
jgi:hypothetical protein